MKRRELKLRCDQLQVEADALRRRVEALEETMSLLLAGRMVLPNVPGRKFTMYDDQDRVRARLHMLQGLPTDVIYDEMGQPQVMATEDDYSKGGVICVVSSDRDCISHLGGGYLAFKDTPDLAEAAAARAQARQEGTQSSG